ncbi:MAG: hypothetical protein AAF705_12320, partial [Bacteroidota bacterium]
KQTCEIMLRFARMGNGLWLGHLLRQNLAMSMLLISMMILTMVFIQYNAFIVLIPFIGTFQISLINLLLGLILIAGLLGTCRFYLQKYEPNEVYGGYMVGFLAPFIALQIMVAFGKIELPVL